MERNYLQSHVMLKAIRLQPPRVVCSVEVSLALKYAIEIHAPKGAW